MNDYRITFQNTATDSRETITITARSESEAQRTFRKDHKGDSAYGDIWSCELYRENTMATKAQERETLEKIKAMVEELGPQSYLATAFDGCFRDAEDNIDDDAAYSYKDRYETALKTQESMSGTIQDLQKKMKLMQETIDRLQREAEEAEARTLRSDDLQHLIDLEEMAIASAEQRRDEAAATIVELADNPASEEFQKAVTINRNARASVESKRERLERLRRIQTASSNG